MGIHHSIRPNQDGLGQSHHVESIPPRRVTPDPTKEFLGRRAMRQGLGPLFLGGID